MGYKVEMYKKVDGKIIEEIIMARKERNIT
jgi:hypothetical protein